MLPQGLREQRRAKGIAEAFGGAPDASWGIAHLLGEPAQGRLPT